MKLNKLLIVVLVMSLIVTFLAGCSAKVQENQDQATSANLLTLDQITELAKKEGKVVSVGMPDSWANWKDTWKDLKDKYGIDHVDTDMSSAEEVAKFENEKNNPTSDIGDVGWSYGPVAKSKGLTIPYKTSYWDSVPDWAKDDEGDWMLAYTGTMAILTNKELVKDVPKSFDDILKGNYKVSIGDATAATQSQMAVLSAAIAMGGDESDIQPGVAFFEELAKQGRLSTKKNDLANIEKGEVAVTFLWDFNALAYRDQLGKDRFDVYIPAEASIRTGYTTIINKYAPHPNAAMLAREYIFSDEGQINLARGYAKPVREDVKLPEDVKQMLLPSEQYKNVKGIKDFDAWKKSVEALPQLWQEKVLVYIN